MNSQMHAFFLKTGKHVEGMALLRHCLSRHGAPLSGVMKILGSVGGLFLSLCVACAAEFDHSHAALDRILKARVKNERVDYAALKADSKDLDAWLKSAGAVTEAEFNRWSQPQQLAFLMNLYNAATLRLILDNYPLKSIKDIGSVFKGPWKQEVVPLFGKTITLDYLEHSILRKKYTEPRVHFAIVCAAKGCPPLRAEAYVPDKLNEQLDEQGRIFLGGREKNRFDSKMGVLFLSPIFKWFSEDFEKKSGSVTKFVTPFFPPETQKQIQATRSPDIRYTDYDWSLNEQPKR